MGSKQRAYMPEFREGAVRIVVEAGRAIPEVDEELGVHSGALHGWVSWWRRNGSASSDRSAEPAPPGARMCEAEHAELEWLRREMAEKNKRIRELEMERDVLKRWMVLPRSSVTRGPSTASPRLACRVGRSRVRAGGGSSRWANQARGSHSGRWEPRGTRICR
ncbi:transposase [Streptomyces sp. NPDC002573]|uniref:transposase n=1 Tax=Streptomyces sp. NPDC002573 TaxID=3364651 RepID=UPI00367AA3B0